MILGIRHALRAVLTQIAQTRCQLRRTVGSDERQRTDALVAGQQVDAVPVLARIRITFVDVNFAICTSVSGGTRAVVASNSIDAGRIIPTRIGTAFVLVNRTVVSTEALLAFTLKPVNAIDAPAAVQTRIAGTFIDIGRTQVVIVADRTLATERVDEVYAAPSVQTRI